jgi:hypothetical protein
MTLDIRRFRLLAPLLASFALAACAGLGDAGKTPEQIVAQRAQARWDAILADNWETAHGYATPAYRERTDVRLYRGLYGGGSVIARRGAEVGKVECPTASACEVTIAVRFVYADPRMRGKEIRTTFPERWLLEDDGRWYIYHQ